MHAIRKFDLLKGKLAKREKLRGKGIFGWLIEADYIYNY